MRWVGSPKGPRPGPQRVPVATGHRPGRRVALRGGIGGGTVRVRAEQLRCPPGSPPPRTAPAEFGVILQRKIMVIFLPPYA